VYNSSKVIFMEINKLTENQKKLRRRILDISHNAKASHIGSCLSVIDLVDGVYGVKRKDDRFILSNGHAAVALYVVLEKLGIIKVANLEDFHVHPDRNLEH
jgi:transketolase